MSNSNKLEKHFKQADPEVQNIVQRVLKMEREKLSQKRPNVNADIQRIITEEITEEDED